MECTERFGVCGCPQHVLTAVLTTADRLARLMAVQGGSMCTVQDIEGKVQARQNVLAAVHKHWWDKRKRIGNALLRKFQIPTSINDLSPLATFRPREKEKVHRKTRRNDADALNKLKQLRLDFDRSRTLLEVVTRREKLKKDILIMTFKIQNAENDQAWDFLDEDHSDLLSSVNTKYRIKSDKARPLRARNGGKSKPGLKMEGDDDIEGYCSSASTTTSSDWSETSSPRASPTKIVSPSRVRKRFDDDGSSAAEAGILPMTDDLQLSATSTMFRKRQRRFTGRGRVGRGGRMIFDRALRVRHEQMQEALQLGLKPELELCQLNGATSVSMTAASAQELQSAEQLNGVPNGGAESSLHCAAQETAVPMVGIEMSATLSSNVDAQKILHSVVQPVVVDAEMANGLHALKPPPL